MAEQIKYTTKAVELIIAQRLENMKTKFKSISELENAENKINRRLTSYRKASQKRERESRRSNRHSKITEVDFTEGKVCPHLIPNRDLHRFHFKDEVTPEEHELNKNLIRVRVQKEVILSTLGEFETATTIQHDYVDADLDQILNRPINDRPVSTHENGFSRGHGSRNPINRSKFSKIRSTKSTNL